MSKKIFSKELINLVEKNYKKNYDFDLKVGDVIKVEYKLLEAGKERIQLSKGIVIAIQNKGLGKSFTLRRRVQGIGIEQIFLYHSPKIETIKKEYSSKVRRSKLYYLRNLLGKASKLKIKI